jgi:hypothetical protein
MENNSNKGSIWRIWDLHVHTPASKGNDNYQQFIDNASQSEAHVIGINDYCTLKGYEEILTLGGIPNKVMFPVVEFRMENLLITRHDKNGEQLNFHIIFDNEPSILPKISNWLNSIPCNDQTGNKILLGDVTNHIEREKLTFNIDTVIEKLTEISLYQSHALLWLPYNEYGGADEINPVTDKAFKTFLVKKADFIGTSSPKEINFFSWKNSKYSK